MMAFKPNSQGVEHQIAVWGPTGSGKTWLIKAFGKELKYYDRNDPYFHYHLEDQDGTPISLIAPEAKPTDKGSDWLWRFSRSGKLKTPATNLSSFSHDINIHDDKGSNYLGVFDYPGQQTLAEMVLKTSPYLIVLLDPTLVPGNLLSGMTAPENLLEKSRYIQLVEDLCSKLRAQPGEHYLAVCVTKYDLTDLHGRNAWDLIAAFFGMDMTYILQGYMNSIHIEAFTTSAAGYYNGHANFDLASGTLKFSNPDQWNPHNIAAPFFWLFELDERQRLGSKMGREDLYIPYPRPKH